MIHVRHRQGKEVTGWRRVIPLLCCVVGCGLGIVPQANAAFIGNYALSQFTLTNVNADGFAITPDNGLSIVLTGGNNGSGLGGGTTDLVVTAVAPGLVGFSFLYSSKDYPFYDWSGYLLDGMFMQLADTDGQSGTAGFQVTAGQSFGFRVETLDNTGEPGVLTISDFSAPQASVPEPGTLSFSFVALVAILAATHRQRSREVQL